MAEAAIFFWATVLGKIYTNTKRRPARDITTAEADVLKSCLTVSGEKTEWILQLYWHILIDTSDTSWCEAQKHGVYNSTSLWPHLLAVNVREAQQSAAGRHEVLAV